MTLPPGLFDADPHDDEAAAVARRQAREAAENALRDAVHALMDATVRTQVADEELVMATEHVRSLTDLLSIERTDGSLGLQRRADGRLHDPGNPMVGRRNPIAPPLVVVRDPQARTATTTFSLGALYEGPPTCVHGGMSAAVLDQVCGAAAALSGKPGMTAYLNLTYRRPTFLFQEHTVQARVEDVGEWKTLVRGEIRDSEGRVTVEAEGLFVVPRIARSLLAPPVSDAAEDSERRP